METRREFKNYSNCFKLSTTKVDGQIMFHLSCEEYDVTDGETGVFTMKVADISMPISVYKKLGVEINNQIKKYEKKFGVIDISGMDLPPAEEDLSWAKK